jgi:hypothetical protein
MLILRRFWLWNLSNFSNIKNDIVTGNDCVNKPLKCPVLL